MRILFVLPRIVSGGVERVTLNLIAEFLRNGHACTLAVRTSRGELLDEARTLVEVHELAPDGMHQFVPRLSRLIKSWQPSHVVTAFTDVAALTRVAMWVARSRARWVHSVHNTHAVVTARRGTVGRLRYLAERWLANFVYRRADSIVAVSCGVRDEIVNQFGIAHDRVVAIYNPVVSEPDLVEMTMPRHASDEPFTIVAIGRLSRQKGFDTLIEAMRAVPPPWRLEIWGDGEERRNLEELIAACGMRDLVSLRGYTSDPYGVLRRADLFVLSSRWEGLPTVLIEALACQCQIIATDCPQGPREILLDGALGGLVPPEEIDELSKAIRDAIGGRSWIAPEAMVDRARDFTSRVAAEKWEQALARS